MQVIPGQASRVDYEMLAAWLLRRAQEVGAERVLEDLCAFTQAIDISVLRVSALEGLRLSRTCVLDQHLRLLPWDDLPQTPSKRYIEKLWAEQTRFPTAAIVREFDAPKLHFFSEDAKSSPIFRLQFDDTDLILCAGLFGPVAPVILASWTEFPSWFPRTGLAYSYSGPTDRAKDHDWPEEAYERLPSLYNQLKSLPDAMREHLRVPLDRLNKAMRRPFPVDAAIDLGIALESLFLADLDDDRGELSFRLRVRGARYLAQSADERRDVDKHLRALYRARSIAVHTGVLPTTLGGMHIQSLLGTGYVLAATALRSMIENGPPDWNQVVFS
jgi:hypothetical protein